MRPLTSDTLRPGVAYAQLITNLDASGRYRTNYHQYIRMDDPRYGSRNQNYEKEDKENECPLYVQSRDIMTPCCIQCTMNLNHCLSILKTNPILSTASIKEKKTNALFGIRVRMKYRQTLDGVVKTAVVTIHTTIIRRPVSARTAFFLSVAETLRSEVKGVVFPSVFMRNRMLRIDRVEQRRK